MVDEGLPPFVKDGTLTWTRYGYHYLHPPGIDLLAPEALASQNPWIVVAATLEQAKAGNHSLVRNLTKWFRAPTPMSLDRVCILLTGNAGTDEDLEGLATLMREGPDDLRSYACMAAADAGSLSLVPCMLDAWHRVGRIGDHETIGYAISDLLEAKSTLEDVGPIAAGAGAYDLDKDRLSKPLSPKLEAIAERASLGGKNEKFDQLVRAKLEELAERLGSDKIPVWGGEPFGVTTFAEQLLSLIRNSGGNRALWGSFIPLRRKFEASTGVDCSSFFKSDIFQPLSAAALLEKFLLSAQAEMFQESVRYFFGHQIPSA